MQSPYVWMMMYAKWKHCTLGQHKSQKQIFMPHYLHHFSLSLPHLIWHYTARDLWLMEITAGYAFLGLCDQNLHYCYYFGCSGMFSFMLLRQKFASDIFKTVVKMQLNVWALGYVCLILLCASVLCVTTTAPEIVLFI